MTRPSFTLTVAATRDGFIARAPDHPPSDWVSAEEQVLFRQDIAEADWSIMGRHTHDAAPNPDRRRIVFTTKDTGWRGRQLFCDPRDLTPDDLAPRVVHIHPLRHGLILGGTRVHDWFLAHRAIDRVHLTVEPVSFGDGLPIFTGQAEDGPEAIFAARGFHRQERRELNDRGTTWLLLKPA